MSESLRHRLRTATASAHQRLDDAVSKELDFAPGSYRVFLRGLARDIAPIETALDCIGIDRIVHDWPARKRTDALKADLADFGENLPDAASIFSLHDTAEALGALYVLEGSRLGSQLLLKQARACDSPVVRNATRHLAHGQGQKFWPGFIAILDLSPDARNSPDRVVEGANRAFAFIHEAFTASSVARLGTDLRLDAVNP